MLNLEMGLYGGNRVEMQSLGWPQPSLAGVLLRGGREDTDRPRGCPGEDVSASHDLRWSQMRTCLHAKASGRAQ